MSEPTLARRNIPAATPEEAAALICRAVTRRARTIWPWWARLGQPFAAVLPGLMERIYALYLRADAAGAPLGALRRVGLLSPLALLRTARAANRYGSTLAGAFAAGPSNGTALIDRDGPVSVAELSEMADECAAHLAPLVGVNRVGLASRPGRDFVVAATALGRLGVDTVPVPPETPAGIVPDLLDAYDIAAIVHDGRYDDLPVPSWRWPPDRPDDVHSGLSTIHSGPLAGLKLRRAVPPAAVPVRLIPRPAPQRRARLVALTSGSTGEPKAVRRGLPVRTVVGTVGTHLREIPLRPGVPFVLMAPPHHGYGLSYVAAGLALGAPVILAAGLPSWEVLGLVEQYGAEVLVALPIQLRRLLTTGLPAPGSLRAIVSGAAPLPVELHQALVANFGDIIYNLYGTTEAGWAALATPEDLRAAPGTVGRAPYGVRLLIRDASGALLAPGQVGEVYVRGWLRGGGEVATGDVGHLDPVGRLMLHGRVDRMIVSGGVNVYPERVEAMLALHPDVARARLMPVADDEFGQRLAARVRLHPGATLTPDDLRDWLRERLPPAQRPRDILISESSSLTDR